jgi:hypothetical protein
LNFSFIPVQFNYDRLFGGFLGKPSGEDSEDQYQEERVAKFRERRVFTAEKLFKISRRGAV